MTTFIYTFEAIGLLATAWFLLYLASLACAEFKSWRLKRNRVHDDLNAHEDRLRDHQKRIEFLETCERQRLDAENRAKAARQALGGQG